MSLSLARAALEELELSVFGEHQSGNMKQRLLQLERELGLAGGDAEALTIIERIERIRG